MERITITKTQWHDMHQPSTIGDPLAELREKIEKGEATVLVTGFSDIPFERKVIIAEDGTTLLTDSTNN